MKTGRITKEEEEFCEKIDWHPVDEFPLKEEFIKKLKKVEKGSFPAPSKGRGTRYFPNSLPKNTFIDDTEITFSNSSSYGENLFPYP